MLCPDIFSVLTSLELILNQRLLRQTCSQCKGNGCEACIGTGYLGRRPIAEVVTFDDSLRSAVRSSGSSVVVPKFSLQDAGLALVKTAQTTPMEIERVLGPREIVA
jgi:general secretion pathway protein E